MIEALKPLITSSTSLPTVNKPPPADNIRLEDMSAKAMRKLEYVFKMTEEKEGPLSYETFKSVVQAVLGQRVTPDLTLSQFNLRIFLDRQGYNMLFRAK